MSFGHYQNFNNNVYLRQNPSFYANAENNKKNVSSPIEKTVDTIFEQADKEKKSNKKAVTVGISALLLTGFVLLLNPKNAPKLMSKMKSVQQKAQFKMDKSKNDYLASKFHKFTSKLMGKGISILEFSNNFNSAKDLGFKWLCTENKDLHKIRNPKKRRFIKKIDDKFVKIMKKPHQVITSWFDSISKMTVKKNYSKSAKKLDYLEDLLKKHKDKLSGDERKIIDAKLEEIAQIRKHFSEEKMLSRLKKQEESMSNLERDFMNKYRSYRNGFSNKWVDKGEHIGNNMNFWAQDILMPTRDGFEKEGKEVVDKLFGDGNGKKGLYDEITDILSSHVTASEKDELSKQLSKAGSKLRKANRDECIEYFDKKRDLVLGSAPTDVLTALFGLGVSSWAIASADTKEDKLSKTLTVGFPLVAGIGTSLAFTAMLVSGVKSMLYGALASVGLSKMGSLADRYLLGNEPEPSAKDKIVTESAKEVKSA